MDKLPAIQSSHVVTRADVSLGMQIHICTFSPASVISQESCLKD